MFNSSVPVTKLTDELKTVIDLTRDGGRATHEKLMLV